MRILILMLILSPLSIYAQDAMIEIEYKDGSTWSGDNISVFNGENGEASFVILNSLDGVRKEVVDIVHVEGIGPNGQPIVLNPVIYHGSLILSELSYKTDRVDVYNSPDVSGFIDKSSSWGGYHYSKDGTNLRNMDYVNLYEDFYENLDSRTYLIKANRIRKIQNAFYSIGGVLFAHALFSVGFDSSESKVVIPISLYLSASSFVVPRLIQRSKSKYLRRAIEVYK